MDLCRPSDVSAFWYLSRLVIAFLPGSKHLLISWLQSPSAVILEPRKIKSVTVSTFSPSICHGVMGLDATILVFWMLSFKTAFSLSSFTFIKRLFSSSSLSAIRVFSSACLRFRYFFRQSWFQLVSHPAQRFSWCICKQVKLAGRQYTALTYSCSSLETVCCSMSSSNCCFLTCI